MSERALLPTDPNEEPEMRTEYNRGLRRALFCVPSSGIDSSFNFVFVNGLSRCYIVARSCEGLYPRIFNKLIYFVIHVLCNTR